FLEHAGVPPLPEMESRSLAPLLRGEAEAHRPYVRSGLDEWRLVFDGRFKLVQDEQAGTLLFDLLNDPEERHNVAGALPSEVQRLAPLL
ncbi:MAG: hypothetical protein ACRDJN_25285, partial [Chloroflexota bacterium]